MRPQLTLVSHPLCPYVQRAAIVLMEKDIAFKRVDIDLANKPDWFLKISPLGKTPVLLVDDVPIFESAVICEYLDETTLPRLHPENALARARHRAWMEFGSSILNTIAGFYTADSPQALAMRTSELKARFEQIEKSLAQGPWFAGASLSMVDAVFAPIFRYFDVFDRIADFGVFARTPNVRAWRSRLALRHSVQQAVSQDYPDHLRTFLLARRSELSRRMAAAGESTLQVTA